MELRAAGRASASARAAPARRACRRRPPPALHPVDRELEVGDVSTRGWRTSRNSWSGNWRLQCLDQEFLEIRHPRVESVADPPARREPNEGVSGGRGLHARRARVAERDADALPERKASLLRSARPSDRRRREVLGSTARMKPGAPAALERRVLPTDVGDRVRRGLGRRSGIGARGCRHRSRRCLGGGGRAPLSIYLGSTWAATRRTSRSSGASTRRRAVHDPPVEGRRPDEQSTAQRLSEIRGERIRWMRGERRVCAGPGGDLRRARICGQVHRRLGCPVLEVSELSIEEISGTGIVQLVERRKAEGTAASAS